MNRRTLLKGLMVSPLVLLFRKKPEQLRKGPDIEWKPVKSSIPGRLSVAQVDQVLAGMYLPVVTRMELKNRLLEIGAMDLGAIDRKEDLPVRRR